MCLSNQLLQGPAMPPLQPQFPPSAAELSAKSLASPVTQTKSPLTSEARLWSQVVCYTVHRPLSCRSVQMQHTCAGSPSTTSSAKHQEPAQLGGQRTRDGKTDNTSLSLMGAGGSLEPLPAGVAASGTARRGAHGSPTASARPRTAPTRPQAVRPVLHFGTCSRRSPQRNPLKS